MENPLKLPVISLLAAFILFGCSTDTYLNDLELPPRRSPIKSVDDVTYFQLFGDGFSLLDLQTKLYAYHLYRACVEGREILYDQLTPDGVQILQVLNLLAINKDHLDVLFQDRFDNYAYKFWLNNSNYDLWNYKKFVPEFSFATLARQIELMPESDHKTIVLDNFNNLNSAIFDPNFKPILTIASAGDLSDSVSQIALNLYDPQIKLSDINRDSLIDSPNIRLSLVDGEIREEIYRAGVPGAPPGRSNEAIEAVINELEKAAGYAPEEAVNSLVELIKFLRTGDYNHFQKYLINYTEGKSYLIEFIFGFEDKRFDPLDLLGLFQGMVLQKDYSYNLTINTLHTELDWFVDHLPIDNKQKKYQTLGENFIAYKIIGSIYNSNAFCTEVIEVKIPFDHADKFEAKKFILTNVIEAYSTERSKKIYGEFINSVREREEALFAFNQRTIVLKILEEVLGGNIDNLLEQVPERQLSFNDELKFLFNEIYKSSIGLWYIGNPKLVELGVLPGGLTWQGAYRAFLAQALIDIADKQNIDNSAEFKAKSRIIIANYIRQSEGCKLELVAARYYLKLISIEAAQNAVGDLLREISDIYADQDAERAMQLIKKYSYGFDNIISGQIMERFDKLKISDKYAFIMPDLIPIKNRMGGITDIEIRYPGDLMKQVLRYDEIRSEK